MPWHGLRHQGISAWVSASCASRGRSCAENRRLNVAENRLGWKQSKRAPPVFPENSEIRVRCLTEITFQLPKLQIWLNVSVTACLLLFIQAPTKRRQMKELFLFQTKRERTKIHKKLSGEGNWRCTSLTSHFMDLLKCITSPLKPL